jgi:tetratricopeptide (TPR) repeat protein
LLEFSALSENLQRRYQRFCARSLSAIQFLEAALARAEKEKVEDELLAKQYDEVLATYQRAIKGPMRKHVLVHFAYADFHERRGELEKAAAVYEAFVSAPDVDPTSVSVLLSSHNKKNFHC